MEACSFEEENLILDPPRGVSQKDCESLPVWIGHSAHGVPVTVSCWKITKEELAQIQTTGRIYLVVMGHTMFPVHLTTDNPIKPYGATEGK